MTHDELLDAMRDAAIKSANRARRRPPMSRVDFAPALDVVLDEVLRQVTPVIEREWCGGEVLRRIRGLTDPSRKSMGTALAGQDLNNGSKVRQ